jgi:multidrug efflux system membrane fusion protein
MRFTLHAAGLIFAAASLTSACTGGQAEGTGAPPPGGGRGSPGGAAVPITVAKVVQKPMPLTLRVIGAVEASSNVAVHAQITGELTSVHFTEGDDVKMGDVLFTFDRRPLESALQQAEANLARDVAQAENAASQAKRYADLAQRGIATREQVDTASANSAALQATVGADRAAVDNARVQLDYATITSPISGRTGALMVHPGNLVRANDTSPLVLINQVSPINVTFAIPESQLPELKRYMAQGMIRVEAQPPGAGEHTSEGHITFVDNAVDQTTGTIRIKGSFPNQDHSLWPGQYVNVMVTLAVDRDALVVPAAAVQAGQQGNYVFVIGPNQNAELRPVEIARSTSNETIIKSGVKLGETVVTDGHLRLVPGSRVSVKTDASKTDAPKTDAPKTDATKVEQP